MKNSGQLFKIAFALSIIIVMVGAVLKITHAGYSEPVLLVGLLLSIVYIATGIYEVNTSNTFDKSEKIMWTVGFIFMASITAIVYLLVGRKKAFALNPKL